MRIICRTGRGVKADIGLWQCDFTPTAVARCATAAEAGPAYSIGAHSMPGLGDTVALSGAWTQLAHPAADDIEPRAAPEPAYYY